MPARRGRLREPRAGTQQMLGRLRVEVGLVRDAAGVVAEEAVHVHDVHRVVRRRRGGALRPDPPLRDPQPLVPRAPAAARGPPRTVTFHRGSEFPAYPRLPSELAGASYFRAPPEADETFGPTADTRSGKRPRR